MTQKHAATAAKSARACGFDAAKRIGIAVHYHRCAELAAHQMAAWAALCGLELQWIKKHAGHGRWLDFHAEHISDRLPERTAQKYMQVAESLRLKVRRCIEGTISFVPPDAALKAFLQSPEAEKINHVEFARRYSLETWELLETSPCRLNDAQRARLAAAVEYITDGETMADLIEAYRLIKRPLGSGVKGGYQPDAGKLAEFVGAYHPELAAQTYEAMPAPVQTHYRKWAAQKINDPAQLAFDFLSPVFNAFEHPDFGATVQKLALAEKQRMLDHAEALVRQLREDIRQTSRTAA